MKRWRQVVFYGDAFEHFLMQQPVRVQDKVYKVIEAIEFMERIPPSFFRSLVGVKGLYEARIRPGSNIWRVFCCFDEGHIVVFLSAFQKKTQKTPRREIERAKLLMEEYYESKK